MTTLDITGISEAIALVEQNLAPALDAAIFGIVTEMQGRIAPYPAPRRQRQAFKTAKQRRGFFAKLRKGKITVPYRRTGQLGSKWVVDRGSGQLRMRNTRRGAKYVHSEKDQAAYHRGNWKTDKGVADEVVQDGTAAQIVEQALQKAFNP